MIYLILSIISSVSVGVLLKYAKKNQANIFQMVSLNYILALGLSFFLFDVSLKQVPSDLPFKTLVPLGILMPSIFVALFFSIAKVGIIKSDIAQRMSLLIPILGAVFIFHEQIAPLKYAGLFLGLCSIYFTLHKKSDSRSGTPFKSALYPLLVFIGFGVIDLYFKQIALYSTVPYTTSLFYVFACAFFVSVLINLYLMGYKKQKFQLKSLLFGLPLGLLNFMNIFWYLKAHRVFASSPTTVFAGMNFGVIILGTLIGYLVFNETLSRKNKLGLLMTFGALVLIVLSHLF